MSGFRLFQYADQHIALGDGEIRQISVNDVARRARLASEEDR
jgi:hypothetical protein